MSGTNSKAPLVVGMQAPLVVGLQAKSSAAPIASLPPPPSGPPPLNIPAVTGGRWNRAGKSSWKPGPFTFVESAKAESVIDVGDADLGDTSASPARLSPVASVRSVGGSFAGSYSDAGAASSSSGTGLPVGLLAVATARSAAGSSTDGAATSASDTRLSVGPLAVATARSAAGGSADGGFVVRDKNSVDCDTCFAVGHWRTMRMVQKVDHWQETKDDKEDTYIRVRTCMECVAVEMGVSPEEAYKVVMAGAISHKKKRYDQLQYAKANVRTQMESLSGVTRKERRTMTMSEVMECFAPLGKHILRKRAALERIGVNVARHAELVILLENCRSFKEECPLIAEMEALEVDDGYLAFADQPDQHDYIMAASYSDQWCELVDASGKCTGSVNSWYVCMAGTGPWDNAANKVTPCFRITPSKEWGRKHADPLATKQKWYCSCYSKYNCNWGQIVEISRYSQLTKQMEKIYLRSDVPPWDGEDVRAMHLEETLKPKSSRELYDRVKTLRPVANALIEERDGHMRIIDREVYNMLAEFKWAELNNMAF
jgi:hypothetical protein